MSIRRGCCCGGCVACHPSAGGSAPNNAAVTGAVGCTAANGTYTFNGADVITDLCRWFWDKQISQGVNWSVILYYARASTSIPSLGAGCAALSLSAGEWAILHRTNSGSFIALEKTTNFSCSPITGKVSGTHTMLAACRDTAACGDTATITVSA